MCACVTTGNPQHWITRKSTASVITHNDTWDEVKEEVGPWENRGRSKHDCKACKVGSILLMTLESTHRGKEKLKAKNQ